MYGTYTEQTVTLGEDFAYQLHLLLYLANSSKTPECGHKKKGEDTPPQIKKVGKALKGNSKIQHHFFNCFISLESKSVWSPSPQYTRISRHKGKKGKKINSIVY